MGKGKKMIYVMSDIHGCYDKYIEMLNLIDLKDKDTLYIIGDIIDRGNQNIAMIRDVMNRDNVVLLMGNHEDMMVESKKSLGFIDKYTWYQNGGRMTDTEFKYKISREEQVKILRFLEKLSYKLEIEVNNRKFLLVHGSYKVGNSFFKPEKGSREYKEDIIWNRIKINDSGLEDKIIIFGHTPTCEYQTCEPFMIWFNKNKNLIGIDCGMAGYARGNKNSRLGCLRLDDMKEFYV